MLVDKQGNFITQRTHARLCLLFACVEREALQLAVPGRVELTVVKPRSRCVIPSIDPDKSVKNSQILTALRRYRLVADRKTYFGQNVMVTKRPVSACLRVGDAVEVPE